MIMTEECLYHNNPFWDHIQIYYLVEVTLHLLDLILSQEHKHLVEVCHLNMLGHLKIYCIDNHHLVVSNKNLWREEERVTIIPTKRPIFLVLPCTLLLTLLFQLTCPHLFFHIPPLLILEKTAIFLKERDDILVHTTVKTLLTLH